MTQWKRVRKQARRYARRIEEETEPQRRRLGAEARRRAPGFAAFAIATALEMMRQRRGPERRPRRILRFGQTVLLVALAGFLAALFFKPKR